MKKLLIIFSLIYLHSVCFSQNCNFVWAKGIGTVGDDSGNSIAVDGAGNVYTTGNFHGTVDFDPGVGVFTLSTISPNSDIFISKLSATGTFIWAKSFGASGGGIGKSITVDVAGNVFITGFFQGTADFDPSVGIYTLTALSDDAFVSKLDPSGAFVWAKSMRGGASVGNAIAIDGTGNIYTTGNFEYTVDFDPGPSVYSLTSVGGEDIFISKLDASGAFIWAKGMGGSDYDIGFSIALDLIGNVYTTGGYTATADFDPSAGIYTLTSSGDFDIFVSKLDASGNFLWAKSMGGSDIDGANSIAVDGAGNVYTTGNFQGSADFDPGAGVYTLYSGIGSNIFISKLDASGVFLWAKSIVGAGNDGANSIAVDATGNIFTTGYFQGAADFDPSAAVYTLTSTIGGCIFISELDASGAFVLAKNIGGGYYSSGNSIATDAANNIFVTGSFNGTGDFDPGAGVYNLTSPAGVGDIFVAKYANTPAGVRELQKYNSDFNVFPNPTNGKLFIESSSLDKIIITNCLGQIVYDISNPSLKQEIDLSSYSSGFYFLGLQSQSQQKTFKILKE